MLINKVAEIVALFTLPFTGTALHLSKFHLFEALMIPVIPLKHILDTCSLVFELHLFPSELWFELGQVLFNEVKLNDLLRLNHRVI